MDSEQPFLPVAVNVDDPLADIFKIICHCRPDLVVERAEDLQVKPLVGGLVNRMFLVSLKNKPDEKILVRVSMPLMEGLIDREKEYRFAKFLSQRNLYAKIYGRFSNGVCYAYQEGRVLTLQDFTDPKISKLIAEKTAEVHAASLELPGPKESKFFERVRRVALKKSRNFVDPAAARRVEELFPNMPELHQEVESWIEHCRPFFEHDSPVVLTHNDLLPNNIILNPDGNGLQFIDFEIGELGLRGDDIGNYMTELMGLDPTVMHHENYPSEEFQLRFIRQYLEAWAKYTSSPAEISEKDVWNLYVRSSKAALLKILFCFGFVVSSEEKNPDYKGLVKHLDWDSLYYGRRTLDMYFLLKPQVEKLQLR